MAVSKIFQKQKFDPNSYWQYRACYRKKDFPTKARAESELRRRIKNGMMDDKASTYKCQYCHRHHITSGKKRESK